jgi:hypothetical protein
MEKWVLKNVKIFPTKYDGSTNSCITTTILEDYITQIDRKVGAKNIGKSCGHCLVCCSLEEHNISQEHKGYVLST